MLRIRIWMCLSEMFTVQMRNPRDLLFDEKSLAEVNRSGIEVKPKSDRSEIETEATRNLSDVEVTRSDIEMTPKLSQSQVELKST